MDTDHDDDTGIDPIPNPDVPGCFGAWVLLIAGAATSGAALLLTARWILRVA